MNNQGQQLGLCLRRLNHHLDLQLVALTGGAAIGLHLQNSRVPGQRPPLNDVDLVACSTAAISPTVTSDFLVSHFHVPHPGYLKFLVQLVDPVSRFRVDVFPGLPEAIERAAWQQLHGIRIRVLGASDVLDHKMSLIRQATTERPIDPKHLEDAKLLGELTRTEVGLWPSEIFSTEEYLSDPEARCVRCDCSASATFSLAPKQRIIDILGYC